jgi:hypothetical protein
MEPSRSTGGESLVQGYLMYREPMWLVTKRAIGHESVRGHIVDLSGVASDADGSIWPGPVIVGITVADSTLDIVEPVLGSEPLLVSSRSLLLVAVHAILLAELHAMGIRSLPWSKRRGLELLPLGIQGAAGPALRRLSRDSLCSQGSERDSNEKRKDYAHVHSLFHLVLLFHPKSYLRT